MSRQVLAVYRLESGVPTEIIDEIETPINMDYRSRDRLLLEKHGSKIWLKWQTLSGKVTPRKLG